MRSVTLETMHLPRHFFQATEDRRQQLVISFSAAPPVLVVGVPSDTDSLEVRVDSAVQSMSRASGASGRELCHCVASQLRVDVSTPECLAGVLSAYLDLPT